MVEAEIRERPRRDVAGAASGLQPLAGVDGEELLDRNAAHAHGQRSRAPMGARERDRPGGTPRVARPDLDRHWRVTPAQELARPHDPIDLAVAIAPVADLIRIGVSPQVGADRRLDEAGPRLVIRPRLR